MSFIKPGQIIKGAKTLKKESNPRKSEEKKFYGFSTEIESLENANRNRRFSEFEMGEGNRMFPKSKEEKKESEAFVVDESLKANYESYRAREDYDFLEEKLGVKFSSTELLERALTHRSALAAKDRADYERLEFLGDAVLDLGVADLLSQRHPEAREGELSKMRAALVNTQALADFAVNLEIAGFIKLGRGEFYSGGASRPSILADVTEAIFGAIYRDQGYDQALSVIENIFGDSLEKVNPYDPKTELQEVLHSAGSEPPKYMLETVEGPEHAPTFVTVVVIDEEVVARGKGSTKKSSQQNAAAIALDKMTYSNTPVELKEDQEFFIPELMLVAEKKVNLQSIAQLR